MSNIVPASLEFSKDQVALIRQTIAPTASQQEFDLFIYRCRHMGLDPLKPGQIFFIKYGNSAGSIVVGREGFRSRAQKTGKHAGTKLGVIRDGGKCVGAWAEVYRKDWEHPARVEVSLAEYNTGKSQWAKMPETMIQKIAEAAALRMAFPDDLGGLYIKEEMDQAEAARDVSANDHVPLSNYHSDIADMVTNPGDHKISFGVKYNGMTIAEAVERDGETEFRRWTHILQDNAKKGGYERPPADHQLVIDKFEIYIRQHDKSEQLLDEMRMNKINQYTSEDALFDKRHGR